MAARAVDRAGHQRRHVRGINRRRVAVHSSSFEADAFNFLGDAANYAISLGVAALVSYFVCVALLRRNRGGDANRRSVWLCSRNDAIDVVGAAFGVFGTGTG